MDSEIWKTTNIPNNIPIVSISETKLFSYWVIPSKKGQNWNKWLQKILKTNFQTILRISALLNKALFENAPSKSKIGSLKNSLKSRILVHYLQPYTYCLSVWTVGRTWKAFGFIRLSILYLMFAFSILEWIKNVLSPVFTIFICFLIELTKFQWKLIEMRFSKSPTYTNQNKETASLK